MKPAGELGRWGRYITAGDANPALTIDQQGSGDILDLQDGGTSVFTVGQSGAISLGGSATLTLPNTGLHLLDTNASHDLIIAPGSDLTADHTLTLTTGDADRTITLSGNPTLADWFDQAVKTTSNPTFGNLTITSFAANWTNAGRTVADLGVVTTVDINGGTIGGVTADGAIRLNNSVNLTLGTTDGTDWDVYHDGSNLYMQKNTGGLTIGLAASPPAPDNAAVHIWSGTAGTVTAIAGSGLVVENSSNAWISFLRPAASQAGIWVGEPTNVTTQGGLNYRGANNRWEVYVQNAQRLFITANSLDFQQASTISTTATTLTLNPAAGLIITANAANSSWSVSSAGVARSLTHDITVGAGGAANAQLSHQFQLDSVFEAGLSGETDGAAGVTAATQVWKVPYRDSGANVAAPATLNVEVLGGLRVEAGDDTNRIYFRANAAWHYINQTAGLSITKEERFSPELGRNWALDDLAIVRMHKAYGDGGADFLPYPLEEGLRETLLRLLDVDVEFRQQIRGRLNA